MTDIKNNLEMYAKINYNKKLCQLNAFELHNTISKVVMLEISDAWNHSRNEDAAKRRAYYLSAEFLVGRSIYNNLNSSGLYDEVNEILQSEGLDINILEEIEDAALGNGGLGRLASCFLDSAATLGLPLDGYGIRYGFGLFKQKFENGFQIETIDDWTKFGDPWSIRCDEDAVTVHFADQDVLAIPYDMPIIGYGLKHISTLRLWQCEPINQFDLDLFNAQEYDLSLKEKNMAEDISRVLYPNDSTQSGKLLRLKQQYFFCSASLQDIIANYNSKFGKDYSNFSNLYTLQLNDTHPTIAIPEFIRLLMKDGVKFDDALSIAKSVFNYTNHTIMQEALEKRELSLLAMISQEIADIILKINDSFIDELNKKCVNPCSYSKLLIVQDKTVHMAYLACFVSKYINGVAHIHTDILKNDVLQQWYEIYPEKFQNKTNGVTQRRWLALCNPGLSKLITELLGSDHWITDLNLLKKLSKYADDKNVLDRFIKIKNENKKSLQEYIFKKEGVTLDINSIIDVQAKRLHEYKRQLLNIISILELYFEIKEGRIKDFTPTTFIFGAKAAPGYFRAKAIIKFINEVSKFIENDPDVNKLIKVIFVTEYNVSYAEKIFAATDVSEQISTAGTEASGTGNMKMMINGAITLGTYDGANIEIFNEAGIENNYVFGASSEDIANIKDSYEPMKYYKNDYRIKRCLDSLIDGTFDDNGTHMFKEIFDSLLSSDERGDEYYLLLDFSDYLAQKIKVNYDYKNSYSFAKKQWINMCNSGEFSSDRTIKDYAKEIWKIY